MRLDLQTGGSEHKATVTMWRAMGLIFVESPGYVSRV